MIADNSSSIKFSLFNFLYIPLIPFLNYLNIQSEPLYILAILLFIDYVTGISKAFILKGSIRSYRAIAGLITKVAIVILILAIALMAKGLGLDFKLYLQVLLSALIISETYSIVGNIYSIISRKEVEEFDAVAMVIKRVRFFIERMFIFNRNELDKKD